MRAIRLCGAVLAMALACAPALAAEETHVFISNGELTYFGPITAEANQKLAVLHGAEGGEATVLSIRSGGGETGAGMELGAWVRLRKLDVKVMEVCLSSCANYVFTAGRNKIVSNFAVVGYHGGLGSTNYTYDPAFQKVLDAMKGPERATYLAQVKQDQALQLAEETAYFRSIGVRPDITLLGQAAPYLAQYQKDEKVWGWTYSIDNFAKLGVDKITVINGPWAPRLISGKHTFFPVKVDSEVPRGQTSSLK
jgi:hypothetical protein